MKQLESIRSKTDVLKQAIFVVERSKTREEALEKLMRMLEELEAEYDELLLGDPRVRRLLYKEPA